MPRPYSSELQSRVIAAGGVGFRPSECGGAAGGGGALRPLTIVTLGLFLLVLNAAMLGLTALLVPGFVVHGFWPAVWGAIVVSIMSWATARLFAEEREQPAS